MHCAVTAAGTAAAPRSPAIQSCRMSTRPGIPRSTEVDARAALSRELMRVLREPPYDVMRICRIGAAAHELGMAKEVSVAFRLSVDILRHFIAARDVDAALLVEGVIYETFVKAEESEAHYEECFSRWRDAMAGLGRAFQAAAPPAAIPVSPGKVAFIFHSGVVLGHTEVLFRLLDNRDKTQVEPRLYALHACDADFVERAARLGIPVERCPESVRGEAIAHWLRERMAHFGEACAIWVSTPVSASFFFGARVAPVQVFWSLRFHPLHIPEIDGYITYGSWAEAEREFHAQRWIVCPVPLALDPKRAPPAEVAALRARFPQEVLLGTLAREEKIDSADFLESVAAILRRNPQCGFVWTGKREHPRIAGFLRERGVGERCHFVGWVDTALYAAALDVFLESFPLGCGITGYQAMAAGVPVVSYLDANTIFGMQYWSEVVSDAGSPGTVSRERLDEYPVLCARDPAEYVDIVSRLVTDAAYRDRWREREARFYEDEIRGIARYSKRYFDAVSTIAARTLSR